ncbi:MAG: glycosyltransferase family 4 protein [Candidatus Zambryskibacteria bacterium]|nr:glycosyltransferase family 4 protein [Candidatus Zambryskibacteria bacterium]
MFGWEFPPFNSGGLGVACEGLSKALVSSGVDLTFVLPVKLPISIPWCKFVFANESDIDEEQIKDLFSGYQSHSRNTEIDQYGLPKSISGSLMQRVKAYASRVPIIARKNKHSVIHAHDWLTYPAGIAAHEASGKPLVVHVHATQFDQCAGDNINKEVYNVELEGYRKADAIVTVSNRVKNTVINKYGIPSEKIKVVHNGVEFQKSDADVPEFIKKIKDNGGKIVLFAGRITVQKGPDYFVKMAEKVLQHEPNTYFIVSGSGDMEGQMIRMIAERGLSSKFIFCGFLRGKELATIYRDSDIYVMPSVSEPFGLLPLETMVSGTPALISKESGVSEITSNILKSHFWDVDDMSDKVISVLRHDKLCNYLSENGNKEVKNIHWKKAAESLISVYNSLDDAFSMFLLPSPPAFESAKVPSF